MSQAPRRFLSAGNTVSMALIAVAASVALVGVVWASTSAVGDNDTVEVSPGDSVPSDDVKSPSDGDSEQDDESQDSANTPIDLSSRIEELSTQLDTAVKNLAILEGQVATLKESSDNTKTQVSELESDVKTLKLDISAITKNIQDLTKTVDNIDGRLVALDSLVQKRTSLLNDEGKYTGTIAPSQISPQLRVSDISGDWPLNRTTGDLEVSKLYSDLFNCTSDFRNHAVITIDAFRRMTCLRIPK